MFEASFYSITNNMHTYMYYMLFHKKGPPLHQCTLCLKKMSHFVIVHIFVKY